MREVGTGCRRRMSSVVVRIEVETCSARVTAHAPSLRSLPVPGCLEGRSAFIRVPLADSYGSQLGALVGRRVGGEPRRNVRRIDSLK